MSSSGRAVLAILASGAWINGSEFLRNQVLLNGMWVDHYRSLGLEFPSAPINAAVWVLWGFAYAGVIYALSRRFSLWQTFALGWVAGFFLMWLVTWNLSVLPLGLLLYAIPLSLLEAGVATAMCHRIAPVEASR